MNYQFHNETPIVFNTMLTNRKKFGFWEFWDFWELSHMQAKKMVWEFTSDVVHILFSLKSIEQTHFFKKLKLPDLIYFKIHSWLSFAIELGLEGSGAIFLRQIKMQGTLTYLLWRFERHEIKTVPIRIWSMFPCYC